MKTLLLNLWAWVVLHPVEVVGAFVSALGAMIAAATAINPRLKGPAIGWLARFIDALAARTRQGAVNGPSSWPIIGRSVFDAAVAASMPQPSDSNVGSAPDAGAGLPVQLNRDGTPPAQYVSRAHVENCDCDACKRSAPGFAERGVLAVIAGICALALGVALLTGCPLPAPDNCTPFATRCSPSGIPETCSQSQRWSHAPPASPCSSRGPSVCCRTRSPWGNELYACAPLGACLPETAADAGAEVSDAQ